MAAKLNFRTYVKEAIDHYPDHGEPAATRAGRVLAGWRVACRAAGREPFLPPADPQADEPREIAAKWRALAAEEGQRAMAWRYDGHSAGELADAWLAMNLRTPSGQPMAEG